MKRFDFVVNRAADRIRADLARIDERFPTEQLAITREETVKHMEQYGHMFDPACSAPHCEKVRAMFGEAERVVMGGA